MKREDAIDTIKRSLPSYLAMKGIDTGSNGKKPFRCLNPTHTDLHPSMSLCTKNDYPYPRCKCFSCGANYGTFDLLAIDYHINPDDFNSLLKAGCEVFGLVIDDDKKTGEKHAVKRMVPPAKKIEQATGNVAPTRVYDFTQQVDKSVENIERIMAEKKDYDQNRADAESEWKRLSVEEQRKYTDLDTYIDYSLKQKEIVWKEKSQYKELKVVREKRGFNLKDSFEVMKRFRIGYDSNGYNSFIGDHEELKIDEKTSKACRIFIPFLDSNGEKASYFMAEVLDRDEVKGKKYIKPARMPSQYFQEFYITEIPPKNLYIVEGVWSAIQLENKGRHALALCGAQNYKKLLNLCKENSKRLRETMFCIATDDDEAGENAAEEIAEGFDEIGLLHVRAIPHNGENSAYYHKLKDLGEVYEYSHEHQQDYITPLLESIEEEANALRFKKQEEEVENRKAEQESYIQTSAGAQLSDFLAKTKKNHETPSLSTGFKSLDKMIAGGLRQGRMYILGGMSAVGKTAFLIQLSDFLAAEGHDVLYISLEMSQIELMSRSISRESALSSVRTSGETWHAKTAAQIEQGELYADISTEDFSCVRDAIESYRKYADHIYIVEGNANLDVFTVRDLVQKHKDMTGNNPVVITDYMQIMAPSKEGQTDKQVADQQIKVLKQTARDLEVPMVVVSSFNRNSYQSGASYSAYKETGAIEYTADALLALQYSGLDGSNAKEIAAKAKQRKKDGLPVDVEIVSLKSRQGYEDGVKLAYFSRFNLFLPENTDIKKISDFTAWQEAK